MPFSLKTLAKACIEAETLYAIEEIPLEPRFILVVNGKKTDENVTILTGMEGRDLCGQHLHYNKKDDKTLVLLKCVDVRDFFDQAGWKPESFGKNGEPLMH
jgi:hypothetical protein